MYECFHCGAMAMIQYFISIPDEEENDNAAT